MPASGSRRTRRRNAGLLLTPLIDVIFLLVLFFVINTSFRQERYIDVVLPESETSEDIQADGVIITLRADGTVAVDGEDASWEALTARLRSRLDETGAREVIIRGDENVPYGRAVSALDRVRMAGTVDVSLQTVRGAAPE